MASIKNASPQFISYGADDKSSVVITPESIPVPKHLPLFYIYAKKGNTKRNLVTASSMQQLYGYSSFDINEKWFNSSTRFLKAVVSRGNTCMVQRLVPKDAGIRANAVIYADIIPADIPNYKRNADGGYVVDPLTQAYVTDEFKPVISGYKIKFVQETKDVDTQPGTLKTKTGTMSYERVTKQTVAKVADQLLTQFRNKYKVNEFISLPITSTNVTELDILSSNKEVIDFVNDEDSQEMRWKAVGVGTSTLTITAKGEGFESSTIQVNVTVVDTAIQSQSNLMVSDIVQKLTPDTTSMTLDIQGDTQGLTINVKDPELVKIDTKSNKITGLKNGVTTVTIYNQPVDGKEVSVTAFSLHVAVENLPDIKETVTSTMYPLFEIIAKYQGEDYNNLGFSITSPSLDVDSKIISSTKSLPFKLALYTRDSALSSPSVFRSLYGEPSVQFSFKSAVLNPNTEARMDLEEVFKNNWFNETNSILPLRFPDYEAFYFYRENYETLTKKVLEKEQEFISSQDQEWSDGNVNSTLSWFDFTTDKKEQLAEENYIVNLFSSKSSKAVNYFTLAYANIPSNMKVGQKEVLINGDAPIFLNGGNDGTFSKELFEELVVEKLREYADEDSEVQDLAVNVETTFYDPGFSLATKKELVNFIAIRKDTNIALSTHDDALGAKDLPLSDVRAIGNALKTRLQLAPESDYYGTPVARAIVLMGTGLLRDGSSELRIPLTYELAIKAADMMGASTGLWNGKAIFDKYPNSTLTYLTDYHPEFIPSGIKPTLWMEGLVWAQPLDRSSYQIPALQTIYDDDTSVLNNYFVMMALGECTKSGDRVWRKHVGTANMTNDEFIEAVEATAASDIAGVFDGVVSVAVTCNIDSEDEKRGYSWHMVYKLYGDNLKTVGVMSTEVYRSTNDSSES